MNIYKKEEGKAYTLDAREVAPMAATHDMYDLTCMKRMTCEGKPSMFYFPYMKTNIPLKLAQQVNVGLFHSMVSCFVAFCYLVLSPSSMFVIMGKISLMILVLSKELTFVSFEQNLGT